MSMTEDRMGLIERFLDDSVAEADAKAILQLIDRDPEFRAEFAAALRMRGLLAAGFDRVPSAERLAQVVDVAIQVGEGHLDDRVMDEIRARGSKRRWTRIAAVVAAGWLIAISAFIMLHEPQPIVLSSASAGVVVERKGEKLQGRAGQALAEGDIVSVPIRNWGSIRYADGTSVELSPDTSVGIEGVPLRPGAKRLLVRKGRVTADVLPQPSDSPMTLLSAEAEARVVGTSLAFAVDGAKTRLHVHHGTVAFSRRETGGPIDVHDGEAASVAPGQPLVAEPAGREVLKKLGKDHVMLGVMSSLAEPWVEEVKAQGARFDLRYQHLAWNWTKWNANGGFIPMYAKESEKLGTIPVFSYYCMIMASPGKDTGMGPAAAIAVNCIHPETMKRYWSDVLLFMQRAGEFGKPVILHVEPDVWGHFLSAPEFRPNDPSTIRVAVKSAGLPDLQGLDDTLASFGKAFGILRDRHAPNVVLAWHASRRTDVAARSVVDAFRACGTWDVVFTDVGDRDAGFRQTKAGDATGWWTDKDFDSFRDWAGELYAQTGLPLFLWRLPLGNRVMAACNNTPWHYMDNRAEYWLESYPENKHLAQWAASGFAGFLFGGGTMECTVHKDNAKDGVTNPAPASGNKGETSTFPDDDGGYLRLRAANYYKSGPLPLPGN